MKKQLFLSHAWGNDIYYRDNHCRVKKLSRYLNLKGWTTWLDENEIHNNIDYSILKGITECQAVLICLTSSYFSKINKALLDPTNRDSCLKEWTLASSYNKILIPVIMEKHLLNHSNWPVSIMSLYLGYTLYFDFSTDNFYNINSLDKLLKKYKLIPMINNYCNVIRKQTNRNLFEKIINTFHTSIKTNKNKFKSTGNLLKIAI